MNNITDVPILNQVEAYKISYQLAQTRNELNNIRKSLQNMKAQFKGDFKKLEELLSSTKALQELHSSIFTSNEEQLYNKEDNLVINKPTDCDEILKEDLYHLKPIGYIKSAYHKKNGTPRQGSLSKLSMGKLEIEKNVFNNPSHSLEGIEEYSHIWILYFFHQNSSKATHSKVSPPRLDGKKVGIFSTRSPHRPNNIGLTLAKVEKVKDNCIHLSCIDIIDGTPVFDIKPYIPQYDSPPFPLVQEIPQEIDSFISICEKNIKEDNHEDIELSDNSNLSTLNCAKLNIDENLNSCVWQEKKVGPNPPNIHNNNSSNEFSFTKVSLIEKSDECDQIVPTKYETIDNTDKNHKIVPIIDKIKVLESLDINEGAINLISETDNNFFSENEWETSVLELDLVDHSNSDFDSKVTVASWLRSPPVTGLEVIFNPIAERQIKLFCCESEDPNYRLEYLKNHLELRTAILSALSEDPRSTYRRQKCQDRLYFFMVDTAHITTCFFEGVVEVLRVHPPSEASSYFKLV